MLENLLAGGPRLQIISLPRGRQHLTIMPTSAGYELRRNEHYEWDGRNRGASPFTVLQHTISGQGNLRHQGRQFRIAPGQTLLLTVPDNHRYWLQPGEHWEFFWISMTGEEALRLHTMIQAAAGPVLRLQGATIEHLAGCALRLMQDPATIGQASAIAYEAITALYDDVFGAVEMPNRHRDMQPVLDHIETHIGSTLDVSSLAGLMGMSRAHFSRRFAAAEGIAPAEYVLHRRLHHAAVLLAGSEKLSVKQVAILCGFTDSNYFSKVFRRIYSVSPSQFRTTGMYASLRREPKSQSADLIQSDRNAPKASGADLKDRHTL
ncbi:AraC family transcriptional regulator [Allorhizobium undicola]|uniref:AraC family transcriptional regulator n=1 Tax=Allorhizobium undicola TaxID=78527 RepID=UPI000AC259CD|nr:AraC family transcriptional regulator [Allorhizobium undicola]